MDSIFTVKSRSMSDVNLLHFVHSRKRINDVEISGLCAPRPEIFPFPVCKRPPSISGIVRPLSVSASSYFNVRKCRNRRWNFMSRPMCATAGGLFYPHKLLECRKKQHLGWLHVSYRISYRIASSWLL